MRSTSLRKRAKNSNSEVVSILRELSNSISSSLSQGYLTTTVKLNVYNGNDEDEALSILSSVCGIKSSVTRKYGNVVHWSTIKLDWTNAKDISTFRRFKRDLFIKELFSFNY